jgi:hypothetical protein
MQGKDAISHAFEADCVHGKVVVALSKLLA